jgi:hypothetical protein
VDGAVPDGTNFDASVIGAAGTVIETIRATIIDVNIPDPSNRPSMEVDIKGYCQYVQEMIIMVAKAMALCLGLGLGFVAEVGSAAQALGEVATAASGDFELTLDTAYDFIKNNWETFGNAASWGLTGVNSTDMVTDLLATPGSTTRTMAQHAWVASTESSSTSMSFDGYAYTQAYTIGRDTQNMHNFVSPLVEDQPKTPIAWNMNQLDECGDGSIWQIKPGGFVVPLAWEHTSHWIATTSTHYDSSPIIGEVLASVRVGEAKSGGYNVVLISTAGVWRPVSVWANDGTRSRWTEPNFLGGTTWSA